MLDSKFFFTLIGLTVAVIAICKTNISSDINEGYWGNPGRSVRVVKEVHPSKNNERGAYSIQNNYKHMMSDDNFVSYPNKQGLLSPRFSSTGYGANINYNMPSYKNQGVPCDPMGFADMAKEGYNENYCGSSSCNGGEGVNSVKSGNSNISENNNYVNALNNMYDSSSYNDSSPLVALGDMTSIDADGQQTQQIIYDRYIFANKKSRLASQGDPIRGDLDIVPNNTGWFNTSADPSSDLRQGALNVIGGMGINSTASKLGNLVYAASGRSNNIVAGSPQPNQFSTNTGSYMAQNMTNQFSTSLDGTRLSDVNISSFP